MDQDPRRVQVCYDQVAERYGERFATELAHKPFDLQLLARFAAELGVPGRVCDLGCGCGHVTEHLAGFGVDVFGLDLSEGQVEVARQRFPMREFRSGDMLDLNLPSGRLAGVVSFYSVVHFSVAQLRIAAREIYRVLAPGGSLLLSFHVGADPIALEDFLDQPVAIDFMFFRVSEVIEALEGAGFQPCHIAERAPYPPEVEGQTRRAYVQTGKPLGC